jgi:hypothetical protein
MLLRKIFGAFYQSHTRKYTVYKVHNSLMLRYVVHTVTGAWGSLVVKALRY